jgi:hypothetical protein
MNALSCVASLRVAPSATNQICQTPPSAPATSILYYGLNDWHWCCNNCRCCLHYITGLVVSATPNEHNAFRISGTTNPITKSLIPEDPNPLTHHCVNIKFHKYLLLHLYDIIKYRTMVWLKYSNHGHLFHAISIPSTVTQSFPCLQEHLSSQLDTASSGQVHQSYIFWNKQYLANTIKLGTTHSLLMIVFAVNFKWITRILEIFCSLSNTSCHTASEALAVVLLIHLF